MAIRAARDPELPVRVAGYRWLADIATPEAIEALASAREEGYHREMVRDALVWARAPGVGARARTRPRPPGPDAPRGLGMEPLEPRTVPRRTLRRLIDSPPATSSGVPAKFGGQPDWVEEPAWPCGPGERPLVFYGQLPVAELDATAYLFVSRDEAALSAEPLSDGNALVIQPGPSPHLPTLAMAHGPRLFQPVHDYSRFWPSGPERPYCRWVDTVVEADPERWTWSDPPEGHYREDARGDWNKLGGTPLFLQGEEQPPGDGWRFAFQFTAGWAGEELADGAECYGFFREDGAGAFLWQCH